MQENQAVLNLDLDPLQNAAEEFFLHKLPQNKRATRWTAYEEQVPKTHPPEWVCLMIERLDGFTFMGVRRGKYIFLLSDVFEGTCPIAEVKRWRIHERDDVDPFEWREKLNAKIKQMNLEEWHGIYSKLHTRLINWGRWARQSDALGQSPIVSIMREIGYKPEFIDEKHHPIDYRDAEEVHAAYLRLSPNAPEREYLALVYCNGFISTEKVCKVLRCSKNICKELERRSMQALHEKLESSVLK